jgi:glycosyltransferase involved in cell wall biosynthesis
MAEATTTANVPARSVQAAGSGGLRLTILSTHPVQYHAHWFRALAARPEFQVHVVYCYHASGSDQARAGFGVEFDWDIPLLDGYRFTFLNRAKQEPVSVSALPAPRIREMLARDKVDVVLLNGWHYKQARQIMFACWRQGIPIMVRSDSQLPTPRSAAKRLLKYPLYRSFIPHFDACLAVGTRSRDYFLHYGARPGRVFVVPHAVEDSLFQGAARQRQGSRQQLRQRWGIQGQQIVFLFAGKFIEKKRPMDFLQALEMALRQEPGVAGLMVGDGPLRVLCEGFVRSRNLPVTFTGFLNQSRMVDAYVAADCLVLPSDGGETWGLVVNEAMACGLPAVVSDAVGCAPDLIQEGKTGAVFSLGDVKMLANILSALAANPLRLCTMGQRACAGLQPHSVQAAVQGVLDAVSAVVPHATTKGNTC